VHFSDGRRCYDSRILQREIDATVRQINQLGTERNWELYGLAADEIRIVEEATRALGDLPYGMGPGGENRPTLVYPTAMTAPSHLLAAVQAINWPILPSRYAASLRFVFIFPRVYFPATP
jgi:hypothetical protein